MSNVRVRVSLPSLTFEQRLYLSMVLFLLCAVFLLWPFVETAVGIILLLAFMLYSYVAMQTGLPPLMHCGLACGK
jgi:uncharacterized membrane protein